MLKIFLIIDADTCHPWVWNIIQRTLSGFFLQGSLGTDQRVFHDCVDTVGLDVKMDRDVFYSRASISVYVLVID